jgi:hypothetical protein
MTRARQLLAGVLCLLALLQVGNGQKFPSEGEFSVFKEDGKWLVVQGKVNNYIARATIQNNNNITGWANFDVETNGAMEDEYQAYGAGYIEGALTTELIYNSWMTQLEYFYSGTYSAVGAEWLAKNDLWVRTQVGSCKGLIRGTDVYASQDCDYWYQIGLVLTQLDGMYQGYNDHCDSDKVLSYNIFLWIETNADIDDILTALDPNAVPPTPEEALENDHCSVLVKYAFDETYQLYHSHATWGHYVNMLRSFKHYTFPFSHPSTASVTVSFSSFPAWIPSGDDYYITDQGLIVTETTNNVFNMSLYQNVLTTTVLYWLRVVVANRMAHNGSEWVSIFGKYNSGTYNNQWQVTDTKLFTPGQPIMDNTLWILEQIPGYVMSADVSFFLQDQSYFPSYNIPYFPFIYNISGYPAQYEQHGDAYSYEACPRANIFRRDQDKVTSFQSFQDLMRYNEYQTDPLSLGDPCNAISARCDLNTTSVAPFGGFDCKATSAMLIKNMTTTALSGPTTLTQPPFAWVGPFADIPHYGQPTVFNFSFEIMQPQNLRM